MNLYSLYSSLHWNVACLIINSGYINEENSKNTDYGALGKAIGRMEKGFVTVPDINLADIGFKTNTKEKNCMYGLGALNGLSTDVAREIIENRPFLNFYDFIKKCIYTKIVQPSKMYNLIKAGCFDSFNSNRIELMIEFIKYLVPEKDKLTMANVNKLIDFNMVPDNFKNSLDLLNFKKEVFTKKNCSYMLNKTQGVYIISSKLFDFWETIEEEFLGAVEYDNMGNICLNSKIFNKIFDIKIENLKKYILTQDAIDRYNYCCRNEVWLKYANGSIETWEMEALSFYTNKHEFENYNLNKYFKIKNFNELSEEPKFELEKNFKTGRKYKRFETSLIAGIVIAKNKIKNSITLNTQSGIVDVKLNKDIFTSLDRKTEKEKSWFTKGTALVVVGYRKNSIFISKKYNNSPYENVTKIELLNERINILSERK